MKLISLPITKLNEMSKNLHAQPFEETTIVKLEIFEEYAEAWIPTFVMQAYSTICIFDFFSGPGYDINKVQGSPIRILDKIKAQIGHIFQNKVKIVLFFNEKDSEKFHLLKNACDEYLEQHKDVGRAIELNLSNEDFDVCFKRLLPKILSENLPSLVYLDQNGIKYIAEEYFLKLEKASTTDFLYFVSSSYFQRFSTTEEFKNILDLELDKSETYPHSFIHRIVVSKLKSKLPAGSGLSLYPFSLKKGANIYGIIFGAKHPRAVDKFLTIAWKRNGSNGEANFDIDEDLKKGQFDLFEGRKPTKIEAFQKKLREKVLNGDIKNNKDAYFFALSEGHIGTHAKEELIKMKREGRITFDGQSPWVTYENVVKNNKLMAFKILKK